MKNTKTVLKNNFIMKYLVLLLFSLYNGLFAQLTWDNFNGKIPNNAVIAGGEKSKPYIVCKCQTNEDSVFIGRIVDKICLANVFGQEIPFETFQILTDSYNSVVEWVRWTGKLPSYAFVADKIKGQPLYITKSPKYSGNKIIGWFPGILFNKLFSIYTYNNKQEKEQAHFYVLINR